MSSKKTSLTFIFILISWFISFWFSANQQPEVVSPIPDQTVNELENYQYNLKNHFSDPDWDELNINISPNILWLHIEDWILEWETNRVYNNTTNQITVYASDWALSITDTFNLTINNNINEKPIFSHIPPNTERSWVYFNFDLKNHFSDPNWNNLLFSQTWLPSWLSLNANTWIIEWTIPNVTQTPYKEYQINLKAKDPFGEEAVWTMILRVKPNNQPYVISCVLPDANVWEYYEFSFWTSCFGDNDTAIWDYLNYESNWLPEWLSLNKSTWKITWYPLLNNSLPFQIINFGSEATDSYWAKIGVSKTIKVINKLPETTFPCEIPDAYEWIHYSFKLWKECFTWDNLRFVWTGFIGWISIDKLNWDIKWLPTLDNGINTFNITGTNKYGASVNSNFTIEFKNKPGPLENNMTFVWEWIIPVNEWDISQIDISTFLLWHVWDFWDVDIESQKFSMVWLPAWLNINEDSGLIIWTIPEVQWKDSKKYNFKVWVERIYDWKRYKAFWNYILEIANLDWSNEVDYDEWWSFSFQRFAWKLEDWNDGTWNRWEFNIDKDKSLRENVVEMFSPYNDNSVLWMRIRIIWVWIFVILFVRAWARLMIDANDESKLKEAQKNILYLLIWWFIFFGVTWILWTALNLWWIQWWEELVKNVERNLLFQVLIFLKTLAFFLAIISIVYFWFKIISAFEKEDKIKAWRKWVLNVIIALVFIKVIDFVFLLAQKSDFKTRAIEFLVSWSKVVWYILWMIMIISIFYAGILFVTSSWREDQVKKAWNIVKSVFLVALVVLMFLLIVYQVFSEIG